MALPEKRTKAKAKTKTNTNKKTGSKSKKIKTKQNKKSLFNRGLFKLVAVAVIVGCGVITYTTDKDCDEKESEMMLIQSKIDAYNIENEDLQRTLDSDDLSAYMESVALEEYGYAYPDERRFYDTSRD